MILPRRRATDRRPSRREFLFGAGGILLLAASGCGGDTESPGGTRAVKHAMGETEVPARPGRIVALTGQMDLDALLVLGFQPVAAGANFENDKEINPWSAEDLDGDAEVFKYRPEPNVEQIATFRPDLILGHIGWLEPVYDKLSEVLVEYISNGGWRERFLAVAEAVGRSERAEEVEAEYERVLSELPEELRETTVAFIRPSDGQFLIDSTGTAFPGSVAEDAGIPILDAPEGVGKIDEGSGFVSLSGERLGVVEEADLIVVPDFRSLGEDEASIAQFERNALWETLPAVQAGRVLQVAGLVYNGGHHYAAELLLREIDDTLA